MVLKIENLFFKNRMSILSAFVVLTIVMGFFASQLRLDAGFYKTLPGNHSFIKTFYQYEDDISGDGDFYINDIYQFDWDSNGGWHSKSTTYDTGSNSQITLQWRYATGSYGDVYLDNIQVSW